MRVNLGRLLIPQIRWHLALMAQQHGWLVMALVFHLLLGVVRGYQLGSLPASFSPPYVTDAVFVAFSGPSSGGGDLVTLLSWLVSQLLFWVWVGNFAQLQLRAYGTVMLLRLGARRWWWLGLAAAVIVAAGFYSGLTLVACLVGALARLAWQPGPSSFFADQGVWQAASSMSAGQIVAVLFGLRTTALAVSGMLQLLIALGTRRAVYGMMVVVALALAMWIGGLGDATSSWQQWLPGAQALVGRHWPFEARSAAFTIGRSLEYGALTVGLWLAAGLIWLSSVDFLGLDYEH